MVKTFIFGYSGDYNKMLRVSLVAQGRRLDPQDISEILDIRKTLTYLSITGKLLFTLLLVVLRIRILSSSDGGFIYFNTRMSIFHHHTPLCRSFSTILSKFSFHDSLD